MAGYHLIRSEHGGHFIAYCGHQQHSDFLLSRDPEARNLCPKCSSRYYIGRIKEIPYRLGDRLNLSDDARRHTYKSIYEILDGNDAMIGLVAIKLGWGREWEVHSWERYVTVDHIEHDAVPLPVMASKPVRYRRKPEDIRAVDAIFSSKEQALFAVPMLIEQGKLPSRETVLVGTEDHITKLRQQKQEREIELKLRAERQAEQQQKRLEQKQLIQEEFAAMLASGKLTNRQSEALTVAAELMGVALSDRPENGMRASFPPECLTR